MGRIEISVNGTPSGSIELPILMGMISSMGASVGRDIGSPVSPRYEAPFEFTGDLREVTIQLATKTRQEDDENGKSEMSASDQRAKPEIRSDVCFSNLTICNYEISAPSSRPSFRHSLKMRWKRMGPAP